MSVEPVGEVPAEPGDDRPHLNRWVTGAALAVFLALAVIVFWPSHTLDSLDRPEESLERLVSSDMDFRAAARAAPAWERRLHVVAFSSEAAARADAIAWYEELVRDADSPLAELYRIILLAEDGQTDAVQSALAARARGDDESAGRLASWAAAAYAAQPPPPDEIRAALDGVRREMPPGWFADRLAARLASRLGDASAEAESERSIEKRGTRMLWRMRGMLIGETLLAVVGLVAFAGWLWGRRAARVASAPIPPVWTGWDGTGLFARGALGLVAVALLWQVLPDRTWSIVLVSALQAVPLGCYLIWYCARSGTTLGETFGLRVRTTARATFAWATLALVGVSTLADVLTETGGTWLGVETHWTDGFQERLVWGSAGAVAADVLDSCVFAPVLEELLFRGVLYGTLRLRLGTLPATIASGALFALAHGYGVVGFASVFASGVLWAMAYERTRSLLPGMLAHAASNVQATLIVLLTLRI
jgi:CAAX protease family protein